MQKWEYLTLFLYADTKQQLQELKRRFPTEKDFATYSPRALIPQLDKLGSEGWELISATPVMEGDNFDIQVISRAGAIQTYTHTYLCIFKRPMP